MARQTGVITFTGKLGNVIGYTLTNADGEEEHFIRSMPEHVERSYATRRAALDFGKASKGGRLLRRALSGELEIPKDGKLINRLNKAIHAIVNADEKHLPGQKNILPGNVAALTGFNFNGATKLDQLLTFQPVLSRDVSGNIRIAVKPIAKKTKSTTHIEIKAIVTGVDFAKGKHTPALSESILVDVKAPKDNVELVIPYTGKETAVVVLQVLPFEMVNGELTLFEDVKYLAADIIGILLPEKDLSVEVNYDLPKPAVLPKGKKLRRFNGAPPPLE